MKRLKSIYFLQLFLMAMAIGHCQSLNWFWSDNQEPSVVVSDGVPLINVPYEMLTEDEKFLKEAAKFVTDIQISSPLEVCQHKVIMKIKTSCSSMTEEQLAKLSVNLLNCQSETEGRETYPCSDEMSIKQCTRRMDADTWNAYHLMSNRARAVCYASRSHQFRALTELTVNKLMQSAQSQIQTLSSLKESQDRLEEQTIAANKIVESNIQELTEEKALIRAGHQQLAAMAEDIKTKLENANKDLLEQAKEQGENHFEILNDLEKIQSQAQELWKKIENSTNRIIKQNNEAAARYKETLIKLEKINETIFYVWDLTNNMRDEIDKKLGWITEYIGTTGENLEKIYKITLHVLYLLAAMIVAAFLQAPFLTRTAILGMVPLNLLSYLKHGLNASLDFVSLTVLIILITAMHYVMSGIHYMLQPKSENLKDNNKKQTRVHANGRSAYNDNVTDHNYTENDYEQEPQAISLRSKISRTFANFYNYIYCQIKHSFENLANIYFTVKSWIWRMFVTTEELSCSYLPARQYYGNVISKKDFACISEDSSDFSESPEMRSYVRDNNTLTGAVLRRNVLEKNISPLLTTYRANSEPKARDPIYSKSGHITPVSTKPLCGARTRSGNPCRGLASKGQNFCYHHSSGSSVMSDRT